MSIPLHSRYLYFALLIAIFIPLEAYRWPFASTRFTLFMNISKITITTTEYGRF
ncbi:hypothetical protein L228DRAFT_243277, partial [Xylona heveae TC161]